MPDQAHARTLHASTIYLKIDDVYLFAKRIKCKIQAIYNCADENFRTETGYYLNRGYRWEPFWF
jgi:hypothetical protein